MAESGVVGAAGPRWLDALVSRRWGVLQLGLALTFLLVGGMLAWWALFGFWGTLLDPGEPFGVSSDARSHLTIAVLIAFVVPGILWVRRGALRDFAQLEPSSSLARETLAELLAGAGRIPPARRALFLGVALVVGIMIVPLSGGSPILLPPWSNWNAHHVWAAANNVILFFIMLEGAARSMADWNVLGRVADSIRHIDLLDRNALAPAGRYGLRGAVLWLVGSSIASLLAWSIKTLWPLIAILCATLLLATVSLVRPAQIFRRRLREAKATELGKVRAKIAEAKESALSDDAEVAAGHATLLPGLLAYEARLESVREWPFDTPTLLRFGALALLASGSWLGGALVERALGSFLGDAG
jgi:hypothetical protein